MGYRPVVMFDRGFEAEPSAREHDFRHSHITIHLRSKYSSALPTLIYQSGALSLLVLYKPLKTTSLQLYSKPFPHALAIVEKQQRCRTQC